MKSTIKKALVLVLSLATIFAITLLPTSAYLSMHTSAVAEGKNFDDGQWLLTRTYTYYLYVWG